MLILVTGATGKVGRSLVARLSDGCAIRRRQGPRALPQPDPAARPIASRSVKGSIADRDVVAAARWSGVTHVVHLATCKETPDDVMDVTVKGLFWLLEEFRTSPTRTAVHPDRRRRRRRPLLLPARRAGHRRRRRTWPIRAAMRCRRCSRR